MNNIEIIQQLQQAFKQKDFETFEQICSPDIQWIQNPGFPNGSTHYGTKAIIENVFKAFNNDWESWGFEVEEYLDAVNSVIVIGCYKGIHKVSKKSFTSSTAHVYDLANAKVMKFRQFTDTKVIWDAMH